MCTADGWYTPAKITLCKRVSGSSSKFGSLRPPYILAATDYMEQNIRSPKKVTIADAAHLPNMDQPQEFQGIVHVLLESLSQ